MRTNIKKSVAMGLLAGFVGLVFPLSAVLADTSKPKLSTPTDVKSTTVVIPVKASDLEKDKSIVRVRVRNEKTGNVTYQNFHLKFNDDGKGNITLTGLSPKTEYAISAKVRKETLKDYSSYSSRKTFTTRS